MDFRRVNIAPAKHQEKNPHVGTTSNRTIRSFPKDNTGAKVKVLTNSNRSNRKEHEKEIASKPLVNANSLCSLSTVTKESFMIGSSMQVTIIARMLSENKRFQERREFLLSHPCSN